MKFVRLKLVYNESVDFLLLIGAAVSPESLSERFRSSFSFRENRVRRMAPAAHNLHKWNLSETVLIRLLFLKYWMYLNRDVL